MPTFASMIDMTIPLTTEALLGFGVKGLTLQCPKAISMILVADAAGMSEQLLAQ